MLSQHFFRIKHYSYTRGEVTAIRHYSSLKVRGRVKYIVQLIKPYLYPKLKQRMFCSLVRVY